ncbi:hypothetical protein PUN28_015138 [Cardiocondyla obscurior]|uniref:Uncharacterized protein n=1 Tax=Cardiocondyla obscurior TaxID=286306 RepID=A0AAW2F393_9HYME
MYVNAASCVNAPALQYCKHLFQLYYYCIVKSNENCYLLLRVSHFSFNLMLVATDGATHDTFHMENIRLGLEK